jgi:hypothetical protein
VEKFESYDLLSQWSKLSNTKRIKFLEQKAGLLEPFKV